MLAIHRSSGILTILLMLSTVTTAAAADSGWYLGVGYGDVTGNYEAADFDDGSVSNGAIDNSDSAWKVFGGYAFGHHLAVELGYVDLHNDVDNEVTFAGTSDGTSDRFDSLPGGVVSVDIDRVTGIFAVAIGSLPLSKHFSINTKGGAVFWEARQTTMDLGRRDVVVKGEDAIVGVAAEYRFNNGFAIRGEVERYFDMGATDLDVAALSVLIRF